jgi:hypothetical protein
LAPSPPLRLISAASAKHGIVNLPQLTIKYFASKLAAPDVRDAMTTSQIFQLYAERAKTATCPTCRTVNMLGMMCAAAVDSGGFLAFVGEGHGGDWPDPRESAANRGDPFLRRPLERDPSG